MKKHKWRVILLLVLAIILAGSIIACGQPDQQAMQANAELRQTEEQNFFELYDKTKGYMEHAHTHVLKLQNFTWDKVADLAWQHTDQYGITRYELFPCFLPSAETVKPVLACYDEYYRLAVRCWEENPYKEPQTPVQETKRLTILQWRELGNQLESQLAEAEAQVQELKLTTDKQLADAERILTSQGWLKDQYLKPFQSQSAEYTALLSEAISNLGQAKQAASELKNWQFTSLAPQEGAVQTLSTQEEKTRVPPATVGAAPEGKKLTYEDDFSNPYSGWPRLPSEEANLDYQNNEYHITVKKFNWGSWVFNANAGRFADFILEADARQVSGPNGGCGLVFRAQDPENFYCFLVWADGYYYISARLSGMWLRLHREHSDLIKTGNSTNHLKVICKGSEFEVYVNGNYLTTVTDNSLADGYVGMTVETSKSEAHFAFDNIKACSIDAEPQ
jgi:hypothetical protein